MLYFFEHCLKLYMIKMHLESYLSVLHYVYPVLIDRAARCWKKLHFDILFFCNIYWDMKKYRKLLQITWKAINHSRRECICIENTIILKSWEMTLLWWPFLNATHSYRVKQFGEKMKRWLFILGQEPTQTPFTNHNVNRV